MIAASADPYQQRVSVVFQPAPASLNASGYTVTSSDDRVITPPNITQQVILCLSTVIMYRLVLGCCRYTCIVST